LINDKANQCSFCARSWCMLPGLDAGIVVDWGTRTGKTTGKQAALAS
jgi:hypothetical protein